MKPTATTIAKMLWLVNFASQDNIDNGVAFGLSHFIDLFGKQTKNYLDILISKTKPKRIVVCMV